RDEIAHHLKALVEDRFVLRLALDAPVPADVVVVTVAILLAVRFVVLLLVTHQIVQRVAVVRRDEIHAGVRPAAARLVNVARPGQSPRALPSPPQRADTDTTHN